MGSPVVHETECQHLNDAGDVNSCKQLCDLPRAIILRILAFLPTKDAVRTSVLSRRWEYLWTSIPSLVFREENNRGRILARNFMDRALLLRDLSSLKGFSLTCKVDSEEYLDSDESRVNLWITAAIRRNVEDLRLHLKIGLGATVYMLPRCIFRCETLRELHLLMTHDLRLPSSVCLTNLKVLTLKGVQFGDDNSVEKLLSCPSLEKLSLHSCSWNLEVLQVSAPNLLYLTIVEDVSSRGNRNSQVRIRGAFVKSFDFIGQFFYDYIISGPPSLVEASIRVCRDDMIESSEIFHQRTYRLHKLLKALTDIKQLFLSYENLEDLYEREDIFNYLPNFHSLMKLELEDVQFYFESREMLALLSRCPILKSLTFSGGMLYASKAPEEDVWISDPEDDWISDPEDDWISDPEDDWILELPPPCFTSSLKEITIGSSDRSDSELLVVGILLGHTAVLEKLLIYHTNWCSRHFPGNLMERLNDLPRASNQCTILIKDLPWRSHILDLV